MSKIGKLKKWQEGNSVGPYVLDINPTNKCNLKCKSCWQRNDRYNDLDYGDELSDAVLLNVIKQALDIGVEKFEITGGGEPFIRKELVLNMVEKIKKNNRAGNITTNSTLFNEEDLNFLIKKNWDSLTFSLDAADAKTQDFLRGKEGTFDKIVNNLQYLSYKKHQIALKFNTVISDRNCRKLDEIIELGGRFNIDSINFETLTIHSELGKRMKLDQEDKEYLNKEIDRLETIAKKYDIDTNIQDFDMSFFDNTNQMDDIMDKIEGNKFSDIACYEPWYHMVIKVDGSVQPCCLYDAKIENVKDSSLEDIWYGEMFNNIRDNIKKNKFSKYCKICNASQFIANQEIRDELDRTGEEKNERSSEKIKEMVER